MWCWPTDNSIFNFENSLSNCLMIASRILSRRGMSLSAKESHNRKHKSRNSGHSTTRIDFKNERDWLGSRLDTYLIVSSYPADDILHESFCCEGWNGRLAIFANSGFFDLWGAICPSFVLALLNVKRLMTEDKMLPKIRCTRCNTVHVILDAWWNLFISMLVPMLLWDNALE